MDEWKNRPHFAGYYKVSKMGESVMDFKLRSLAMTKKDCFGLRPRNDSGLRPRNDSGLRPRNDKTGLLRELRSLAMTILPPFLLVFFLAFSAYAEDKQWTGSYDASSWGNDANWFSSGVPTASDDATITVQDASVAISDISKAFNAKSLTVAGRADSTVTASDLVYGLITPANTTDNSLYIRKGGNVILQGPGTITLKGKFKNSEETLPDEPAFMFGAE